MSYFKIIAIDDFFCFYFNKIFKKWHLPLHKRIFILGNSSKMMFLFLKLPFHHCQLENLQKRMSNTTGNLGQIKFSLPNIANLVFSKIKPAKPITNQYRFYFYCLISLDGLVFSCFMMRRSEPQYLGLLP